MPRKKHEIIKRGGQIIIITTPFFYPNGRWGQYFHCPYCRGFHFHGEGDGHRVAECWRRDSPLKETGYYVKPDWRKAERLLWNGRVEKLLPKEVEEVF